MTMKASKAQLEDFRDSFIWSDITDELLILDRRSQLEYDVVGEPHVDDDGYKIVPTSSETMIHLGEIKGKRKSVNYFLDMIDVLINKVEMEKTDEPLDEEIEDER